MYALADSLYHKTLRISVTTCALLLLFVSGILSQTTAVLTNTSMQQLASVSGLAAADQTGSVEEGALNQSSTLSTADRRATSQSQYDWLVFALATLLYSLLLLLVTNYALDYVRRQSATHAAVRD